MECILCKSSEVNDLEMGELKTLNEISVHYFCMLLSSSLLTNGDENDGILGFLPADIKKEFQRGAKLKCHYCHQMGATIGCCVTSCNRSFHLNCGIKNKCLNQFTEKFKSFCDRHVKSVSIDTQNFSPNNECIICYSKLGKYEPTKYVFATCCKSEWFHKHCILEFANSAGYFFKCPKCNDVDMFTEDCAMQGVYIPQRDAAWEMVENAYQELMERPTKCIADICNCHGGRESSTPSNNLLICQTCGSNCIHKLCWNQKKPYYCCSPLPKGKKLKRDQKADHSLNLFKEDCNKNIDHHRTETFPRKNHKRKNDISQPSTSFEPKRKKTKKLDTETNRFRLRANDFGLKHIRNGNFDQLVYELKIVLPPLTSQHLEKILTENALSLKGVVDPTKSTKSPSPIKYAVIKSKKKSGIDFKNYTITSFFQSNRL